MAKSRKIKPAPDYDRGTTKPVPAPKPVEQWPTYRPTDKAPIVASQWPTYSPSK